MRAAELRLGKPGKGIRQQRDVLKIRFDIRLQPGWVPDPEHVTMIATRKEAAVLFHCEFCRRSASANRGGLIWGNAGAVSERTSRATVGDCASHPILLALRVKSRKPIGQSQQIGRKRQ